MADGDDFQTMAAMIHARWPGSSLDLGGEIPVVRTRRGRAIASHRVPMEAIRMAVRMAQETETSDDASQQLALLPEQGGL
jgi:hypothetical protein